MAGTSAFVLRNWAGFAICARGYSFYHHLVNIFSKEAQNRMETTTMISIQDLWDRFHLAQKQHNADAALCFRRAIEAATRADSLSAQWWRLQGEMCESVAATLTT
jgi:hypothetical protein